MLATDLNTFWNTAACSWRKRMPQRLCVIIKNYVKQFDGEKVQFSWRKISKERTCNFWKQDPVYQMSLIRLSNFKCFLLLLQLVQLHGVQQKPAFLHTDFHTAVSISITSLITNPLKSRKPLLIFQWDWVGWNILSNWKQWPRMKQKIIGDFLGTNCKTPYRIDFSSLRRVSIF